MQGGAHHVMALASWGLLATNQFAMGSLGREVVEKASPVGCRCPSARKGLGEEGDYFSWFIRLRRNMSLFYFCILSLQEKTNKQTKHYFLSREVFLNGSVPFNFIDTY